MLGKDLFADGIAGEYPLPSVTLGKSFAECVCVFAERLGHSAKGLNPVVTHSARYFAIIYMSVYTLDYDLSIHTFVFISNFLTE
jgi:hypothetical protein